MKNKITAKSKKRYFRINRLLVNVRISLLSPMLVLVFLSLMFPERALERPWETLLTSILAGCTLSLMYICLRWLSDIDLDQKEKELNEMFNKNEEKIKELQKKIVSKETPNKKDRKLLQKIKKIRSKNEQIEMSLKVLDM